MKGDGRRVADGRSTRWASHREIRRAELVQATLAAIRRHGPAVGMDEVAESAGTSKTVLYRHFADRSQLYLAVCARVSDTLLAQLRAALTPDAAARDAVAAAVDAYLHLIESDPQVYRFVVHHPALERASGADPVRGLVQLIGDQVARVIEPRLPGAGAAAVALAWGHGLIGLVRAAADPWLDGRVALTRAELTEQLTRLVWHGLEDLVPSSEAS